MGTIYKRGQTYWIKYYRNGEPFYESSKSDKKMVARKLLEQREGEISQGKIPGIYFDKVKFDELAEDLLRDYRINNKKSIRHMEIRIRHLRKHFGGMPAPRMDSASIKHYIELRQSEGAENGTINRELTALKTMFSLGRRNNPPKVREVPYIAKLKESNPRKGFWEHGDFVKLREALPEYLKGFVTFGYKTGWRKSEISNLTWDQVDIVQGIVCLNPGETKNEDARTVYLDDELKFIIHRQWEKRKEKETLLPYVFLNTTGTGPVGDFRKSWDRACAVSGRPGMIFHDFRRTAVRNMVRSGIPERVAMTISGHKTRTIFDRYNIVNDEDLKAAAQRQQAYLNSQTVTNLVTIADAELKEDSDCNYK